jgi:transcriptional regulator with PAS, ATPase and Fis domain
MVPDNSELSTDLAQSRWELSRPHVLAMWPGGSVSRPVSDGDSLIIGRANDCDLIIDHPSVSRRHAVLTVGSPSNLEDLGSANGTRIGNAVLVPSERAVLQPGQSVALGAAILVVHGTVAPSSARAAQRSAARSAGSEPLADAVIVNDDATRRVHETIGLVAKSSIPVLLLGETGVGKDVLAEIIHRRSPRAAGPFVRVNCAAMPSALLESELFGYERGAFTGAARAKAGLVEAADGGTLFLDEIGEMDQTMQSKLLHVLERGEVMPLGSLRPRTVDVRFVAATNRDLDKLVAAGSFRKDLYFRLNGMTIAVPPLAARPSEIAPLAKLFLERACSRLDRPCLEISAPALDCLRAYAWPGNVRELRNAMDRAAALCTGGTVEIAHLPPECSHPAPRPAPNPGTVDSSDVPAPRKPTDMRDEVRRAARSLERDRIVDALERCSGNQSAAARLLCISRRTLVARLAAYKIPRPIKDNER